MSIFHFSVDRLLHVWIGSRRSNGDEPGASGGGGVVSSKVMGPAEYIMSSMKVKLEGNPAVRMTDTVKINDGNTIGMDAAPSQTKMMIMS